MIPFNCESCFEAHNIFSITTDPTNRFYSAITTDSILIFDAFDSLFPLIATYKRSEESIKSQGPNHWIRWVNESIISFGTYAGSYFCIKFDKVNFQFSGSLFTTNVNGVISDVFSYQNLIGICVIGPKILLVNSNAQIVSTIDEIHCQSPIIKNSTIFNKNNLAFISNGQIYTGELYINLNTYTANLKNLHLVPNIQNVGIICSKQDNDTFAFSTYNQNVYISNSKSDTNNNDDVDYEEISDKNKRSITKLFKASSNVCFMEFIDNKNSLLVIDQNGGFTIRNFIFNTNYNLSLSETKTMISTFYDNNSRRLIFLDPSFQVKCINFVNLLSSFAFGASLIYNLMKQKLVCELPNIFKPRAERVRAIPSDLFPIKSISVNTESVICVVGRIGLAVLTDYSLFYDPSIIINNNDINPVWINNILIVFNSFVNEKKKTIFAMKLYTDELLPIGGNSVIALDEKPLSAHSHSTRLIVTFPDKITIFDFDNSKDLAISGPDEKVGDRKSMKIGNLIIISVAYTLSDLNLNPKVQIRRGFVMWENDVFLHLQNNSVINIKNPAKPVWFNVLDSNDKHDAQSSMIWDNGTPQLLCCYKTGYTNILSSNSTASLPINSLWTVNKTIIHIPSNLQYERIQANFTDFSMKMMPIVSDDSFKYGETLTALLEATDFKTVLTGFLDNLNKEDKLDQFYLGMRQLDGQTAVKFLNELSSEYISYLAQTDFDFALHFPNVKPSIQSRILLHTSPGMLERILETYKTLLQEKDEKFKSFVCLKCIQNGNFIRGCTIGNSADFDFCKLLHENTKSLIKINFSQCIKVIETDFKNWSDEDRIPALKVVACSFNLVRLNNWALAAFLILKDEGKVVSLLTGNMPNLLSAMRYTRDFKSTEYATFLVNLQIGL
ncbi:hypothetical protein M9Y10_046018 [Tritrichomonas musculus]|uniref:Ribosome control protein 1 domain-containing protein n=1 Tax=Tritrichomonas musculus TaxID=1915356 RepID=A0ABR2JXX5_9EUKA